MATHSSKTKNDLFLYEHRAKKIDLIWCEQIINYLEKKFNKKQSINDIGCMYGQLYKEILRRNLSSKYYYRGYDIDQNFINLGLKYFEDLKYKLNFLDIERQTPTKSDITICSATFEHLDKPEIALNNLFKSTKKCLILRTMVGSENIFFEQTSKKYVDQPYNINQFNLYDLATIFLKKGFNFNCIQDRATKNSTIYEVGKGSEVFRQIFIIVGEKEEGET